jgi:hypothetical protein
MDVDDIYKIAKEIGETRSIELKTSMAWNDDQIQNYKVNNGIIKY